MAEIKSAFELAMERTKKIVISEEEREAFRQKEVLQKAASLFHRYRDGHVSLNEILREIERTEEGARPKVREALLSQWIDALSLSDDHERLLKGIELLKGRGLDLQREEFRSLLHQYREEKERASSEVAVQLTEALRRKGIYGSAVDPPIEQSANYGELLHAIDQKFRGKAEEVKKALRASS